MSQKEHRPTPLEVMGNSIDRMYFRAKLDHRQVIRVVGIQQLPETMSYVSQLYVRQVWYINPETGEESLGEMRMPLVDLQNYEALTKEETLILEQKVESAQTQPSCTGLSPGPHYLSRWQEGMEEKIDRTQA